MNVSEFLDNLSAMLHGNTLNKVRNVESALQRAANTLLAKIDPVVTIRRVALSESIHDDVFNYSLPSDYKKIIDLYPQNKRELLDTANRNYVARFDTRKKLADKLFSIEGSEGSKIIRINWRSRQPKTLNECDGLTTNGSWSVVAGATNLVADKINFVSGGGSLRFNVAATGDGIQNTTMTQIDLTDEDEVGDVWVRFYIKNSADLANFNGWDVVWGIDLSTNFWTGVQITQQADGTAFQIGWNIIKIPWSTAAESGTVTPSTVDSLQITADVDAAITNMNIDNVTVSIGRNFDIKYYSKFLLKNTSGSFITKTTSGDDTIVLDDDAIQIYLLETMMAMAHQMEGADSGFDINWAKKELYGDPEAVDISGRGGLYAKYRKEYPSMSKKAISYYGTATTNRQWGVGRRYWRN